MSVGPPLACAHKQGDLWVSQVGTAAAVYVMRSRTWLLQLPRTMFGAPESSSK